MTNEILYPAPAPQNLSWIGLSKERDEREKSAESMRAKAFLLKENEYIVHEGCNVYHVLFDRSLGSCACKEFTYASGQAALPCRHIIFIRNLIAKSIDIFPPMPDLIDLLKAAGFGKIPGQAPSIQESPQGKGKMTAVCRDCGKETTIEQAKHCLAINIALLCEKCEAKLSDTKGAKGEVHEEESEKTKAGEVAKAGTSQANAPEIIHEGDENMNTEIIKREATVVSKQEQVALSIDIIKQYICQEATDAEAYNFMQLCKYRDLNPFLREAYLIKYKGAPATMVVGKDAFYRKAQESGKLKGIESGIIVRDAEGKIVEREGNFLFPKDETGKNGDTLLGGWAKVYRTDQEKPTVAKVALNEYIKLTDGRPQRNWATMPATMISKVAKVQALREAFTIELGGCYDKNEVEVD